MKYEELITKLNKIRNGQYVSLFYRTEPTLRAAAKMLGYHVYKYTTCTFQKGVSLAHVKRYQAVVAARTEPVRKYEEWKEWEIKNLIQRNKKDPSKRYFFAATVPSHANAKSHYVVRFPEGKTKIMSKEELMALDIVQPSQFAKREEYTPCISVNIDNIMGIYHKALREEGRN